MQQIGRGARSVVQGLVAVPHLSPKLELPERVCSWLWPGFGRAGLFPLDSSFFIENGRSLCVTFGLSARADA